jgi:hypothetical protein
MVGQSTFDFPRVCQLTITVLQKSKSDYENNKITTTKTADYFSLYHLVLKGRILQYSLDLLNGLACISLLNGLVCISLLNGLHLTAKRFGLHLTVKRFGVHLTVKRLCLHNRLTSQAV